EGPTEGRLRQQAIEAEPHDLRRLAKGGGALQPQSEALGVVKVGAARRMAQGPVRQRAVVRLEDRRQRETERVVTMARGAAVEWHERIEVESVTVPAHDDRGRQPIVIERSSVAVRTERVHRPLA